MFAAALLALPTFLSLNSITQIQNQPLKVDGTRLEYSDGSLAHLRGIDICSLEWSAQGDHVLQSINVATQQWHANIIRLPLSQDRWFGKTDDSAGANEDAYHQLVDQCVGEAAQNGAYIILDLHWSDMGQWGQNIAQHDLPDQNSIAFWQSVGARYANRPNVIFDLYNEPIKAPWMVWRNGGTLTENFQGKDYTYQAAGLQQLLDTIRSTGAKNLVMAGGLGYSSQLDEPDSALLSDTSGNGVLYVSHYYPGWENEASWEKRMVVATKRFPVIVSEFGDDPGGAPIGDPAVRVARVLTILKSHDWNWSAWCMHTSASPCLISDWNYTPTPYFGTYVKAALADQPITIPPKPTTAPDSVIFDDKLENQWQSWGAAPLDMSCMYPVHSGSKSIKATIDSSKRIQFGNVPGDAGKYVSFDFWVNGGEAGGQTLAVTANIMDTAQKTVTLAPLTPNTWTHESISLADLGVAGKEDLKSFTISTSAPSQTVIYLDDIVLVGNH